MAFRRIISAVRVCSFSYGQRKGRTLLNRPLLNKQLIVNDLNRLGKARTRGGTIKIFFSLKENIYEKTRKNIISLFFIDFMYHIRFEFPSEKKSTNFFVRLSEHQQKNVSNVNILRCLVDNVPEKSLNIMSVGGSCISSFIILNRQNNNICKIAVSGFFDNI